MKRKITRLARGANIGWRWSNVARPVEAAACWHSPAKANEPNPQAEVLSISLRETARIEKVLFIFDGRQSKSPKSTLYKKAMSQRRPSLPRQTFTHFCLKVNCRIKFKGVFDHYIIFQAFGGFSTPLMASKLQIK